MIEKWELTIPELTGDAPRRAYVYLPDSWQEDQSRRYPVLYRFDGHNVFFDGDATYGRSWRMLDYLEGTGTQLIVAAVECSRDPRGGRLSEYSPFTCRMPGHGQIHGRGRLTMDWLLRTFKPQIDAEWPTLPGREHTFIAGSSMGGLMSLYAVTEYNRYFSRAACLSPSIWVATGKLRELLRSVPLAPDTVIYMDYGSRELSFHPNMAAQFAATASLLLERRVHLDCRIVPGGNHNEASWERQIPFFMNTLLYEF